MLLHTGYYSYNPLLRWPWCVLYNHGYFGIHIMLRINGHSFPEFCYSVTSLLFVIETSCFLWGRKLSLSAVQANVRIKERIKLILKRKVVDIFVILLHVQYWNCLLSTYNQKRKYGWVVCFVSNCYILFLKYRFQILWNDSKMLNFLCWSNNKSLKISTAQRCEICQILVLSLRNINFTYFVNLHKINFTYFVNLHKIIVT